jgi:hypothetical protein
MYRGVDLGYRYRGMRRSITAQQLSLEQVQTVLRMLLRQSLIK